MTDKQINIFLAAYFSDLENMKVLIEDKNDLLLPIELNFYEIPFTIFDILQMTLDIWEDCKTKEKLDNYPEIMPKDIYENTLLCINYFSDKFSIYDLDSEHYLKVVDEQTDYDECVYFAYHDEDEVKEYLEKGFRKIDIDLANFSYRGNVEKVLDLLKQGANPDFDPDNEGSTILETLGGEAAWAGLEHILFLLEKKEKPQQYELNQMIHTLYAAALSEKMYYIIDGFVKQKVII